MAKKTEDREQTFIPVTDGLIKHLDDNGVPLGASEIEGMLQLVEEYLQVTDATRPKFLMTANSQDESLKEFMATHQVEVGAMTRKKWAGIQEVMAAAKLLPLNKLVDLIRFVDDNADDIETDLGLTLPETDMGITELLDFVETFKTTLATFATVEEDEQEYKTVTPEELGKIVDETLQEQEETDA